MSRHPLPRHRELGAAAVVALAAVITIPAAVFAWGEAGHRITGYAAAARLPAGMPAFFRVAGNELAYLNPEPDRWRDRAERALDPALDGGTAPDHFIDLELAPPAVLEHALHAPDRYAYLDTLAAAHVKGSAMGLLPFRMLEMSQRLREEFRLWRVTSDSASRVYIERRIVNDAGVLGHYVADGSNPAHTTVQYNGWVGPNPHGYATDKRFHSRFESAYVQTHISTADVIADVDTTPRVLPDLRSAILEYLTATNAQVERMYQLDKVNPFDAQTTSPEDKAFVASRLAAGAQMLRDIWWTAWMTSGS